MHLFTNNARATLAVDLGSNASDNQILLVDDGAAYSFASFDVPDNKIDSIDWIDGKHQMATLYNPAEPNVLEIVKIGYQGWSNELSHDVFIVLRGQEQTTRRAWPAGTVIEARITAGMLKTFVQEDGKLVRQGRGGGGDNNVVQLSGWPLSQATRGNLGDPLSYANLNLAREAVGSTPILSLGDTPLWQSDDTYPSGSVVKATGIPGFQYLFEAYSNDATTSSTTQPSFDASGWNPREVYADGESESNGDKPIGFWLPIPDPVDFQVPFDFPLMLTEVGFVCSDYSTTSPPTISVGTDTEPGKYVAAQPLNQITGGAQCQRFVITEGGPLLGSIRVKLDVAADGLFKGRFYWRGVPFEMPSSPH